MAETVQELNIKVKVDFDKKNADVVNVSFGNLEKQLSEGAKKSASFGEEFKKLANVLGLGAIAGVSAYTALNQLVGVLKQGIQQAMESITVQRQFEFQLRALGKETYASRDAILSWLKELSSATVFTETETIKAFQSLLRHTGDVASAQRLLALSSKLATIEGKNLTDVANSLGYAISIPTRGMLMLRREFQSMIGDAKNLDEAIGNLEKAVEEFGGQTDDVTIQVRMLRKNWDETLERAGAFWIPVLNSIFDTLNDIGKIIDKVIGATFAWGAANKYVSEEILKNPEKYRKFVEGYLKSIEEINKKSAEATEKSVDKITKDLETKKIKTRRDEEEEIRTKEKFEQLKLKIEELRIKTIRDATERLIAEKEFLYQRDVDNYKKAIEELNISEEEKLKAIEAYTQKRLELKELEIQEIRAKESQAMQESLAELDQFYRDYEEYIAELEAQSIGFLEGWKGVINSVTSAFKDAMVEIVEEGKVTGETFEKLWDRMKKAFIRALVEMVAEYIAQAAIVAAISAITGVPFGVVMGGIRGTPRLGILGLQKGGIVTQPTLAVIGEKGPEAVIPLEKANNFSKTVNLNLQVSALDIRQVDEHYLRDLVQKLSPMLKEELKI